jgi:hypothetical protein
MNSLFAMSDSRISKGDQSEACPCVVVTSESERAWDESTVTTQHRPCNEEVWTTYWLIVLHHMA